MNWVKDFLKFISYVYAEAEYEFWHSKFGQNHCRHPGVWWYNPGCNHSDEHCTKCGRNLG